MLRDVVLRKFLEIFPQLMTALTATVSAIPDGMQVGWSAPVIPILRSEDSPIKISKTDETWLEAILLIGGLTVLPITVYLVDKIGRIRSIIVTSGTSLISWIIIAFAPKVEYLYLARFLSGASSAMSFVAIYMYNTEISEEKNRGLLSGLNYLLTLVGILIIYAVAPFAPYCVPSIIGGSLLILQLVALLFIPETPYFLLSQGKRDLAWTSLNKLRAGKNIDDEFEEISRAVERQNEENSSLRDVILVKSNRKAFMIACVLVTCQNFSGFTVLLMNLHLILEEAGSIYVDSESAAIVFAASMVAAATVCSLTVDRFGRKSFLIVFGTLTGLCLLSLSIYFNVKASGVDIRSASWIPIAGVMGYVVTFKLGLGFLPEIIASELFSLRAKAVGLSLVDATYVIASSLSIVFYHGFAEAYGIYVPFYVFAGVAFSSVVFTVFVVPETKGKSLEEIQFMLKGKTFGDSGTETCGKETSD